MVSYIAYFRFPSFFKKVVEIFYRKTYRQLYQFCAGKILNLILCKVLF